MNIIMNAEALKIWKEEIYMRLCGELTSVQA
jgi:hypothetical protein